MEFTPEQRATLTRAANYKEMLDSPGWKSLAEFIEEIIDRKLGNLRHSRSHDLVVTSGLARTWLERENFWSEICEEIHASIGAGKSLMEELALEMNSSPEGIAQEIEKEGFYA